MLRALTLALRIMNGQQGVRRLLERPTHKVWTVGWALIPPDSGEESKDKGYLEVGVWKRMLIRKYRFCQSTIWAMWSRGSSQSLNRFSFSSKIRTFLARGLHAENKQFPLKNTWSKMGRPWEEVVCLWMAKGLMEELCSRIIKDC